MMISYYIRNATAASIHCPECDEYLDLTESQPPQKAQLATCTNPGCKLFNTHVFEIEHIKIKKTKLQ